MCELVVYADGFFKQAKVVKPGCSYAVEIDGEVKKVEKIFAPEKLLGMKDKYYPTTTNESEFFATTTAIRKARLWNRENLKKKFEKIFIYSDSQLVVNQLNGIFKVTEGRLEKFWQRAITEIKFLEEEAPAGCQFTVCWISRVKMVELLGH